VLHHGGEVRSVCGGVRLIGGVEADRKDKLYGDGVQISWGVVVGLVQWVSGERWRREGGGVEGEARRSGVMVKWK